MESRSIVIALVIGLVAGWLASLWSAAAGGSSAISSVA